MESLYVPILIAAAVALLVWGVSTAIKGLINGEKRKLQQRLTVEGQGQRMGGGPGGAGGAGGLASQLPLSITRNQDAASGASAMLVRWRPLEGLHRLVVQSYPNMNVTTFTCIAGGCAFTMFMVLFAMTENLVIGGVA